MGLAPSAPLSLAPGRQIGMSLSPYFKYPQSNQKDHLHHKYYLKGFHRQMRKMLKNKGAFPNQDAALKLAY